MHSLISQYSSTSEGKNAKIPKDENGGLSIKEAIETICSAMDKGN